jgi:Asp-tRNA(Asn)/Glu-tRNA(Gln) amidotransferase A subunit family amidase
MEMHEFGLHEALGAFREGRATVMDYVDACCRRIAKLDSQVRAWEWFEPSRALAEAEERAGGILNDLPLFGIPVGVKDIINTRGIPTRMGSQIHANHMPTHSAWVVRRLEALGGIVMGKTVTTEFAYRTPGKTRNPWNTAHTPGGSSSGSAAAVAAGFVPVAIGTQTLGSVIRPAAFCGVVGYKPSFGAISRTGIHPFSSTLDHVGVFARSASDAAWFAACLMGPDARDEATQVRGAQHTLAVPLAPLAQPPRLVVVRTPKWPLASEAQRENFSQAIEILKAAGAIVREVPLPRAFNDAWENVMTLAAKDAVRSFALVESRHRIRLSPPLLELLDRGHRATNDEYAQARAKRDEYRRWLDGLFDGCDAIATISAPGEAPEGLANTGDASFNSLWSQTGLPAITLPAAVGRAGFPWASNSWAVTAKTSACCAWRPGPNRN